MVNKDGARMDKPIQVVIYGNSIFMVGVETILRGQPGMDVTRLSPDLAGLSDLSGLRPDVILFDSTAPEAALALRFLNKHPDVTLIGLEGDGHKAVVVSGREQAVVTTDDLAQVVLARTEEARMRM
jgi:hypothetical protein